MTIRFLLVRCVAAGVLVTLLPRTTRSQLIAQVSGVVRDSASGQPAHRTHVCVMVGPPVRALRCARSDSIGAYHVDSLPAGVQLISVQCEVLQGFSKQLTYDSVALTASGPTRRDWTVQTAGCDPRPVRSVTGVFRGHFTRGIESSAFVPCSADGWFIPSDSLGPKSVDRRRAWAMWAEGAQRGLKWPEVPHDDWGNARYFVKWHGTVTGPGQYGHMGFSPFVIRIDSVFELRAAQDIDCK